MKLTDAVAVFILAICLQAGAYATEIPNSELETGKASASAASPGGQDKPTVTVVVPAAGEKAYKIAAENFVELWEKVTGRRPSLISLPADGKLPAGDLVLIGSDAVNPIVHDLISRELLDTLGLQYGSDAYRILCVKEPQRRYLILAGGCGRSTIYAVYDFFRRQAGVEYFWDGDVVPRRTEINIDGVDIAETPRFRYRGLRYFAHRGLHRFQAEHWDLEDWKREIDWLVKKRFNLFMMRTGHDDLFQRAYPDAVPYPPADARDPDALDRSYDDRTSFWPLKYRGELRKQVMQYARDRGLIHPVDTGTITHWYSPTPSSFYRSFPDFPVIGDQTRGYDLRSAAIWDVENERAWDAYWKLTQTAIDEFGRGYPQMFHTIGMAERRFGKSRRDNLQKKLYVYRKTQEKIRENYPDVPLLIAGWDLAQQWQDEEIHQLLKEFDPQNTILLDYTADDASKVSYRDWKVLGNFPWIFGIFHGFAWSSDMHGDYALLADRLKTAAEDRMCVGLVLWSEISHNDAFMLEYLAENSWRPCGLQASDANKNYCRGRYPDKELAGRMEAVWTSMLQASQTENWSMNNANRWTTFEMPQFQMLTGRMWSNLSAGKQPSVKAGYERTLSGLKAAPRMLADLASLAPTCYDDPLWRRDALDMARTVNNRALTAAVLRAGRELEAWSRKQADAETIRQLAKINLALFDSLADILAQSDDFSMAASLERLKDAKPINGVVPQINPHGETTLKGNAENDYCRSHHYELARYVYCKEAAVFWEYVLKRIDADDHSPWNFPGEFPTRDGAIKDEFYRVPLASMAPKSPRGSAAMVESLHNLESLVRKILAMEQ